MIGQNTSTTNIIHCIYMDEWIMIYIRRLEVEDAGVCNIIHVNHMTQIDQNADLEKVETKIQIGFCRHRPDSQPASFLN